MELRPPGVQTATTLENMAAAAANELIPFMFNTDAFTRAEYTGVSSNVRVPLPFSSAAGLQSTAGNVFGEDPESVQLSITGKGVPSGTRWSSRFFTAYNYGSQPWPATNRWLYATAPTGVQNLFNVWAAWYTGGGLAGIQLVSASSSPVVLNFYVNICKNGWWQRKQR